MNRNTKDYEEARAILETLLAFIIYVRFGGNSAWKDPVTIEESYAQAKQFTGKLETELAKCKQA